ncbi:MAG: hypothetical protein ACYC5K_08145 [Saccharofermentanales bacterium]
MPETSESDSSSSDSGVLAISRNLLKYIGIGMTSDTVKRLTGISTGGSELAPDELKVSEGGAVAFKYKSERSQSFIISMQVTDDSGVQEIRPVPDASAVDDFLMQSSAISLKLNAGITEDDFFRIGTAVSDSTVSGTGDEAYGDFRQRTIDFGNASLVLFQRGDNLGTKHWTIWEMAISDPGYATPRGLSVGMDLAAAVYLLGTGDLVYDLDYADAKFQGMTVRKLDTPEKVNEYYEIDIKIEEGKLTEIKMVFYAP